jgi:sugar-specific transcriptional regulator TrmB
MTTSLELELQRVGLDQREAKIYLAALELGPSPVQKIAQRSQVPRATTYLILDDLQNKGFVTTYDEGKKTFFVAESPDRLAALVDEKEVEVQRQKEAIKSLVPELMSRGQFEKGERPVVRYYEGKDAVKNWLRDMLSGRGGKEILNIFHHDRADKVLQDIGFSFEKVRERRKKQRIKGRVIYTANEGPIEGYSTKQRKAKYVPVDKYPFEADIAIRGDRVFFAPYSTPLRGVVIEDKAIANSMRLVFEVLWDQLK